MSGNKKSFTVKAVHSKSFSFIMSYFDYALTFILNVKNRFPITFVSSAISKPTIEIRLKKIKMLISNVAFKANVSTLIKLKAKIVFRISQLAGITSTIVIKKPSISFLIKETQRPVFNLIISKPKIVFNIVAGIFYKLLVFDPMTLGALDSKILGEMDRVAYIGVCTTTISSPLIVSFSFLHGLVTGDRVYLSTTGSLPTGLTSSVPDGVSTKTFYYCVYIDSNNINLATSYANAMAGIKINTSGSQSGSHTMYYVK